MDPIPLAWKPADLLFQACVEKSGGLEQPFGERSVDRKIKGRLYLDVVFPGRITPIENGVYGSSGFDRYQRHPSVCRDIPPKKWGINSRFTARVLIQQDSNKLVSAQGLQNGCGSVLLVDDAVAGPLSKGADNSVQPGWIQRSRYYIQVSGKEEGGAMSHPFPIAEVPREKQDASSKPQ
jgi:hypothetical protein